MTSDNILIWNEKVGYVRITEGSGDNLTIEDTEERGWVDYIMLEFVEYDGYDFNNTDGAQVMLTSYYQDMFESPVEVVEFLIKDGWIPDEEYVYLYASRICEEKGAM